MSAQLPAPPAGDPLWNEAFERVESYLRAHRIAHPIALNRLTTTVLNRAWAAAGAENRFDPVTLALREADVAITAWVARVLEHGNSRSRRLGVRGRLALALADVPGRWAELFLAERPPPHSLTEAMRAAYLSAGPLPQPAKMTPRPLALGWIATLTEFLWTALLRHRPLRFFLRTGLAGGAGVLLYLALQ